MHNKKKKVAFQQQPEQLLIPKKKLNNYARRLKNFYNELNFFKFMDKRREIARQDVMITPDGPIELYRRDINGVERVLSPDRRDAIMSRYSSSRQLRNASRSRRVHDYRRPYEVEYVYDDVDDDGSRSYSSRRSSGASVLRDEKARFGLPFDWYSSHNRGSQILHDEVEVLPSRHDNEASYYRRESPPISIPSHRSHSRSRRHRRYDDYDDGDEEYVRPDSPTVYDTYFNSSYLRSNSYYERLRRNYDRHNNKFYDVYEYYEYEDDDDDDDDYSHEDERRHGRHDREYRKRPHYRQHSPRRYTPSPSPSPPPVPIPPIRHKKNHRRKPLNYIDYDKVTDSGSPANENKKQNSNKQNSLSSSTSGKELWEKTSSKDLRRRKKSPIVATNSVRTSNISLPAIEHASSTGFSSNNNIIMKRTSNHLSETNTPTDIHTLEMAIREAANNAAAKDRETYTPDQNFNDLPGNDAVRLNPLFGSRTDDHFMF